MQSFCRAGLTRCRLSRPVIGAQLCGHPPLRRHGARQLCRQHATSSSPLQTSAAAQGVFKCSVRPHQQAWHTAAAQACPCPCWQTKYVAALQGQHNPGQVTWCMAALLVAHWQICSERLHGYRKNEALASKGRWGATTMQRRHERNSHHINIHGTAQELLKPSRLCGSSAGSSAGSSSRLH